jgi:hypothetical protein
MRNTATCASDARPGVREEAPRQGRQQKQDEGNRPPGGTSDVKEFTQKK